VKELSDKVQGSDLKKLLAQTAMTNPHIPNLINIASRAGVKTPLSPGSETDEGAFDLEDPDDVAEETKSEWDCIPEKSEISFKAAIREVFALYFVEHFANYENFIIVPRQSYDQWLRNREQFQNFDKTAFISDQPTNYRPFYSAFLETAMFCSFIDQKIVMFWEPERAGQNLVVFDSRVEVYRDKSGLAKPPTTPGSRSGSESEGGGGEGSTCTNLLVFQSWSPSLARARARAHTHTHTHTRMHAHTHIYTYTHTQHLINRCAPKHMVHKHTYI